MRTSRLIILSVLVIGGLLLSACQAVAPTAEPAEPAEPESQVPQGGTVVLMGHQEVSGLSPDNTGPDVEWVMVANIHNAMLELNERLELEPVLAESYEVSDDGLTYTFHLREGVKFHDGTELTSEDVKYTLDYYRNPDNATTIIGDLQSIDNIETPDDYTVVIKMAEVNAAFLVNGATTFIVQSEYHEEVGEDVYRTEPIGTGPFKLKEWRPAEYTELEAFEDHFRGRPNIDILREEVVPEPSVRTIALETGDAHSAVWPLLTEDNLRLAEDPSFVTYITSWSSIKHFPLNNTHPVLSEKAVRQAMMYALDRQLMIDDIWSGAAQIAHSHLSPKYEFYYNPDLKKYDYDPDAAREMLDEAGWVDEDNDGIREKDGTDLAFTVSVITGDQARRPIAEVAQQQLAEVGIEIEIEEAPVSSILEGLTECELDAGLFNWTYGQLDPDPYSTLHSEGGNNFACYRNPQMDELIEAGIQIADREERQPIYYETQEIFVEDVPVLYIMVDDGYQIFRDEVKGLPDPATVLSSLEIYRSAWQWWLEE